MVPTLLIKPLTAVWFTSRGGRLLCRRNVLALVLAGLTSNVGYYLAEVVLYGNWLAPLATQWGGLVQSGGSALVYVIAALALERLDVRRLLHL